jgi:hypothetical protein
MGSAEFVTIAHSSISPRPSALLQPALAPIQERSLPPQWTLRPGVDNIMGDPPPCRARNSTSRMAASLGSFSKLPELPHEQPTFQPMTFQKLVRFPSKVFVCSGCVTKRRIVSDWPCDRERRCSPAPASDNFRAALTVVWPQPRARRGALASSTTLRPSTARPTLHCSTAASTRRASARRRRFRTPPPP